MSYLRGAYLYAPVRSGLGIFGDGSDGDVEISGTVSLSRDMFYNNLTIPASQILQPVGARIFVKGTCRISGTLRRNGNAAAGAVAGTQISSNALGPGAAGGAGQTGAGTAGGSLSGAFASLGGNGGAGGAGGTGAAGAAGTCTAPSSTVGLPRSIPNAVMGQLVGAETVRTLYGGAGGGGGGGDGANAGGGGGSGAGAIVLVAKTIIIESTGVIQAIGGAGANGVAGNAGGGGGGGGAPIILVYDRLIELGTVSCAGGANGTGVGTGANGAAGVASTIYRIPNAA